MTTADVIARIQSLAKLAAPKASAAWSWTWRNRTAVLAVLVVVFALLFVRACGHAERAEAAAAAAASRAAGEARADVAGVPVVRVVTQAVVDEAGERAKREVPELRAELERTKKALGKLRLEMVARVQATPGPALVPVAKGQQLRLGADLVVAETAEGAFVMQGTLDARTLPAGDLVLRQPFASPVTVALRAPPPPPAAPLGVSGRAWRLGPVGGVSGAGWLVGAAYTRRVNLWGYEPQVMVAVAGGPGQGLVLAGPLF